jgi:hypothetical protein
MVELKMKGVIAVILVVMVNDAVGKYVDKRKCPEVRAVPHFDLSQVDYILKKTK